MTTNIREHFVPKWGASEPETKHYNSPVVRPVSTTQAPTVKKIYKHEPQKDTGHLVIWGGMRYSAMALPNHARVNFSHTVYRGYGHFYTPTGLGVYHVYIHLPSSCIVVYFDEL